MITNSQAGFRKGYSTADNIFIVNSLIEIMKASSKKLYCVFIDFRQAFDSVWRQGLWHKLISYNITGKCFRLIRSMYENIKSRVKCINGKSQFFPCTVGVRQGENLSPFLFAIFLNDLEFYFTQRGIPGINLEFNENDIFMFLQIFLLLYADDTVIFAESPEELQNALNAFSDYCDLWKLTVNVSKTKVLIISHGRPNSSQSFYFKNIKLEIVSEYKYLGVFISRSGSFNNAKKHIAEQANKALFSLLRKGRSLDLPLELQIDLFDKMVKPILLYCSEIWGMGNCDIIERIQLRFIKHIVNLKKSTPSYMIYGELGITPLKVDIQSRAISFWSKVLAHHGQPTRLTYQMYTLLHNLHKSKKCKSQYLENIQTILNSCGFSGIWQTQTTRTANVRWLSMEIKQKLKDQFLQNWHSLIEK